MNRKFIETTRFTKQWHELGLSDDDLLALQMELLENPKAGTPIPGTGGIRKIRITLPDRGKRGGGRVIYVDIEIQECICLLAVYSKNEQTDLSSKEKEQLKHLAETLRREDL